MLTFVILDAVAELYGRRYSRLVINLGLVGMAVSAAYFQAPIWLPAAPAWPHQTAFETVLNSSWRIWIGGWIAYPLSQYLEVWTFLALKRLGRGSLSLTARAWLSMLVGQFFDTVVFITIAFYGVFPLDTAMWGSTR